MAGYLTRVRSLLRETSPFTEPGTEVSIQPQVDAVLVGASRHRVLLAAADRAGVGCRALYSVELAADRVDAAAVRGDVPAGVGDVAGPGVLPERDQDAIFAATRSLYGWGDAFLYVTSRYATGSRRRGRCWIRPMVEVKLVDGRGGVPGERDGS